MGPKLQFTNDKEMWDEFLEEIDKRIDLARQILEKHTDTTVIFRAQGAIATLNLLKGLRADGKTVGR